MTSRVSIALLAFTLAVGACSKKKQGPTIDIDEQRAKVAKYTFDKPPAIANKLETVIGDQVRLLGYDIDPPGPVKQGQRVKLTLYWQATAPVKGGWRIFTHVLDGSGDKVLTVENNAPLRPTRKDKNAGLPPNRWELNKVYVDPVTFHVPKTKSDTLQIVAGLQIKAGPMEITAGPKDSSDRAIVGTLRVLPREDAKSKGPKLPSVDVEKLESTAKITIDGKLDEPAWATAPVLGPFVDVATGKPNPKSPVNGSAKLLWNDTNLFVAFEVADASLTGGFTKGPKEPHLWTKDTVELMVDPDGDGDNEDYYEIQINPQNLVFDTQYDKYNEPKTEPDGPFGHEDWSSKLKSAVVVDGTLDKPEDTDKGYTVEAQIPWKSFSKAKKTPPALGDTWRLNLYAMQDNGGVAWSPILGQGNFHKASRFGKVRFTAKGWAPEVPDGGAPDGAAPAASGAAAPTAASAAASGAAQPMPKGVASSLKPEGARPANPAPAP